MQKHLKHLQGILALMGMGLLFWWPLSHWFYPVWYHRLLGFENPSQFAQDPLVTMIGFTGFFPVLLLFFSASDPARNADMLKILTVTSTLGGLTFLYLVASRQFPVREMLNVALFFVTALILSSVQLHIRKLSKESNHVP